jgi:hypothetical protein
VSTNKELWQRVFVTDPKAVKAITGKDYGGNSPKPYWIVERLTDEFGPCGIGWGYVIDSERFERFSETDNLHVAKVTLWYMLGERRGEVTQMGQTKATYTTSQGKFKIDEDAPKKSVTDALVKCASYLGFAGDIFSGRWDDSKYVESAAKHWDTGHAVSAPAEIFKSLQPEQQDRMRKIAAKVMALATPSLMLDALDFEDLDNDEKAGLWSLLDSKTRSAIKAAQKEIAS